MDDLFIAARVCRLARIMQPHLVVKLASQVECQRAAMILVARVQSENTAG
jgi:hypothetical protein